MLKAADVWNVRWRDHLAQQGMVVVGMEYRNTGGELGSHPYPAQHNDIATVLLPFC